MAFGSSLTLAGQLGFGLVMKWPFLFAVYNSSLLFSFKLPVVLGEACVMILLLFFLDFARARPWFSDVKAA